MANLEFFFLLENVLTIFLGVLILIIGYHYGDRLYSEHARNKLMSKWREYSLALSLFGVSLLLYLVSELARFVDPYYPNVNLHEVHEIGEVVHVFLYMFAMILSTVLASTIGKEAE